MATRIYLVRNNQTGEEKLVEATLPAQVIRHVAKSLFAIEPVKQGKLVELLLAGQKPEKASEEAGDNSGAQGNDSQAGGAPEGGTQEGDDAQGGAGQDVYLQGIAEGSAQPEAQAQEGFPADAGTEAASTGRKRR